jgi:hypothetical protein
VVAFGAMLVAGCAPVRVSQTHTASTSAFEPAKIIEQAPEPIAAFTVCAPPSLQGFSP